MNIIFSRLAGTLLSTFRFGVTRLERDGNSIQARNMETNSLMGIQVAMFKMPSNAVDGYVLTSDANGNGTWMESTGGGSGSAGDGVGGMLYLWENFT